MEQVRRLLKLFQRRSHDPKLAGHTSYTRECFELAAKELELALAECEPANIVAFIPPSVRDLVHEALHFDPNTDDDWEALGQAAINIQTGPS